MKEASVHRTSAQEVASQRKWATLLGGNSFQVRLLPVRAYPSEAYMGNPGLGMMPTTYCGPEHPIWQNVRWLRTVNQRLQNG